jgi:hypothetical protein
MDFDCAVANGDPTGKNMSSIEGFPYPAQQAVIPAVINEKLRLLDNPKTKFTIKVWQSPQTKKWHILDGQHSFVATCIRKKSITFEVKKFGAVPYAGGWETTKYVVTTPAKDVISGQINRTKIK